MDKFTASTSKDGFTRATRFADNDKVHTRFVGTVKKMGTKKWVAVFAIGLEQKSAEFKTKHQAQTWLIDLAVARGSL